MRAYRIAYDGQSYRGFQRQPDVSTVENALFDALSDLDVCADEPRSYAAAGRTDAGVSALAQTVAFEAPDWLTPAAFNAELPPEIRAWAHADVSDFHPTHDARRRTYTYFLHAPTHDDERIRRATQRLAGDHDFHNLTPDERGTRRSLSIECERDENFLVLTFSAGGFTRQLVRRAVSVIDDVGSGAPLERIDRVLGDEPLEGSEGVAPAPAHPLVLTDVAYPVDFAVDQDAVASARDIFRARRIEHESRARVLGAIEAGIDS